MSLRTIIVLDKRLVTIAKKHILTDKDVRLRLMIPAIHKLFEQVDNLKSIDTISSEQYEMIYGIVSKWEDYLAYHGVVIHAPYLPLRNDVDYVSEKTHETDEGTRNTRKTRIGRVIRVSGAKSVAVECTNWREHPLYKKKQKTSKTYIVHDEYEMASMGDIVEIMECRPISKMKHHVLTKVIKHRVYNNTDNIAHRRDANHHAGGKEGRT